MAYHLLYLYESLFIYLFITVWNLSLNYLKNSYHYDFQIFTVSLPLIGIDMRTYSARSLTHDVIQAPFCVRALMHIEQTPLGRFAPSLCHPSLPLVEKSWLRQCSVPPPPMRWWPTIRHCTEPWCTRSKPRSVASLPRFATPPFPLLKNPGYASARCPPPPQCVDDPLYATAQSLNAHRAHSTHKAVYTQSRECTRSYTADRRTRTLSILV